MASVDDLNKKLRLEEERDAVLHAISIEGGEERAALQRVLAKIELELQDSQPVFPEVPKVRQAPALPDSRYREPMPSERVRSKRRI